MGVFKFMGVPFKKYSKWDRFLGGFVNRKFVSNIHERRYTEMEIKKIANDAYLQGAIDFNDSVTSYSPVSRVSNTFKVYWEKRKYR